MWKASLLKLNALLPALVPFFVFSWVHRQRHNEPFFRETFDKEYDYIVGKHIVNRLSFLVEVA